jgi:hypothetical protein
MKAAHRTCFDTDGNFIIRPYMLKDLAIHYNVCTRTLRRWINTLAPEVGNKKKKFFTVEQVRIIVTAIGVPQKIDSKKAA